MRLIANRNDNYAFERSINQPPRGIGKVSFDKIRSLALSQQTSFLEACETAEIGGRAHHALVDYVSLINNSLGNFAQLSLLVEHIVSSTKMIAYLSTQKSPQTESKIENIKELIKIQIHVNKHTNMKYIYKHVPRETE